MPLTKLKAPKAVARCGRGIGPERGQEPLRHGHLQPPQRDASHRDGEIRSGGEDQVRGDPLIGDSEVSSFLESQRLLFLKQHAAGMDWLAPALWERLWERYVHKHTDYALRY